MPKNLILIGMPGAGKSAIGQLVAERLGRPFVDADKAIEQVAGRTVPEIFGAEGEVGFRKRETEMLAELCRRFGLVIATGGGCVTRSENHPYLRKNSVIVFLERPLSDLSQVDRPLSQTGDLETMYHIRLPLYQQLADFTVENNAAPETVAARILEVTHEAFSH